MKSQTIFLFFIVAMFSCKQKQETVTANNGESVNNKTELIETESSALKNSINENYQDVNKSVEKLISLLKTNGYIQQETSKNNFIEDIFKTDNMSFEKKGFTNPKLKVSVGKATISLLVYEYSDMAKSHEVFNTIQQERFKDDYLDKNWDILTVLDKYIIRIDAGCTISKDNWTIIKESFIQVYNDESKIINCNCGGKCK